MDEKALAIAGAVAGVTVLRRGLRPAAKEALKGLVALGDVTAQTRDGLRDMYVEAKDEYYSARRAAPEQPLEEVVPAVVPQAPRKPRARKTASSAGKTTSSPAATA